MINYVQPHFQKIDDLELELEGFPKNCTVSPLVKESRSTHGSGPLKIMGTSYLSVRIQDAALAK